MNRTAKVFLIVPLIPAMLFVVLVSVLGLVSGGVSLIPAVVYSAPIWLFFALPISYGVAVVLGGPVFFLFRRYGWLSVRSLTLGSASLGFIVGSIIGALFASNEPFGCLLAAGIFASFGAATGYAFWWLAYRGRAGQ